MRLLEVVLNTEMQNLANSYYFQYVSSVPKFKAMRIMHLRLSDISRETIQL